ncbi:MAG: oligosaccharide flippase family protein [Chloroflexota bacterium]
MTTPVTGLEVTHAHEPDEQIGRRVMFGTLANGAGQALTLLVGFLITPIILAALGPSTYGLWILVSSVVAYGSLLDLGIWGAIAKHVAEYQARGDAGAIRALFATVVGLYVVLGAVVFLIALALSQVFPFLFELEPSARMTAQWLVVLAGAGVAISLPASAPIGVLRGLQRFDLVNLVGVVGTLLTSAVTLLVLWLDGGVLAMVGATVALLALMQAPIFLIVRRAAPDLRLGWCAPDRALVPAIVSYSWPLFVGEVSWRLQSATDEIVIGASLPTSQVTPYALSRRLSDVPRQITNQFVKVLMPLTSELEASGDMTRVRAVYLAGTRLTLAIVLPMCASLVGLAGAALTLWVGAPYAGYAHLVVILTVAGCVGMSQWPAGAVLQGIARHRVPAYAALGSGLANLALTLILVQPYGLSGVALGTLVPTVIESWLVMLPYAVRTIGVRASDLIRQVLVPSFGALVPLLAVQYGMKWLLEPSTLVGFSAILSAGVAAYAVAYLAFGVCSLERRVALSVLGRLGVPSRQWVTRHSG